MSDYDYAASLSASEVLELLKKIQRLEAELKEMTEWHDLECEENAELRRENERLSTLYKDVAALLDAEECDTAALWRDNDKLKERINACLNANQELRREVERLEEVIAGFDRKLITQTKGE